jgi:hypothetical protein
VRVLKQVRTFLAGKPVGMHIPLSGRGLRAGAFMVHPNEIWVVGYFGLSRAVWFSRCAMGARPEWHLWVPKLR